MKRNKKQRFNWQLRIASFSKVKINQYVSYNNIKKLCYYKIVKEKLSKGTRYSLYIKAYPVSGNKIYKNQGVKNFMRTSVYDSMKRAKKGADRISQKIKKQRGMK